MTRPGSSTAVATATRVIDCRSDLVARPTEAMVAAMIEALCEPGAFGLREDPRQQQLEAMVARLLGKEDALLFPTCTMANEAAIIAQCRPGEAVLTAESSHVMTSEAGAPAALAGALVRTFPDRSGQIEFSALAQALSTPADELRPPVSLIVIENTHNRSGGACLPVAYHRAVSNLADAHRVPIHLDGARLFNAAVALECPVAELTQHVTTVAVSLNKGLCAPIGAALAGPATLIREAARVRQRLGGGFRPTGFIAAAGLIALQEMIPRLKQDHANAARAAAGIAARPALEVTVPDPITNVVLVTLAARLGPLDAFLTRLREHGVLALPFGERTFRLVFHRDIEGAAIDRLVGAVLATAEGPTRRRGD